MSEAVRIRPRYLNYGTDLSGRPYAWKYPSVLSRISFAAILCCFCSSPFVNYVVLGWKPFQTDHGNIMSQQGHHGWVRLTSSTMITVSHMLCCMKCTWRPVLVSTLPLHPYTGKSQGPTSLEKKISQDNNVLGLVVGRKQLCRQFRVKVWALDLQPLMEPVGQALYHIQLLVCRLLLGSYNNP